MDVGVAVHDCYRGVMLQVKAVILFSLSWVSKVSISVSEREDAMSFYEHWLLSCRVKLFISVNSKADFLNSS